MPSATVRMFIPSRLNQASASSFQNSNKSINTGNAALVPKINPGLAGAMVSRVHNQKSGCGSCGK